jgi:hypothetical protein
MRDSRPQLLDNIFDDTSMLRNVQQRAVALIKLNKAVKSLLPKQIQPHCRVANYRNGILILETNNANWLMGLRYEQSKLLSTLRADILPGLVAVDIKVNPSWQTHQSQIEKSSPIDEQQQPPARKISAETAIHLKELAERSPERLRQKLERLAELAGESANTTSPKK